jgi:hypothetical protein
MAMKCVAARKKVTTKLLVIVNVYGTKPNKFDNNMKLNKKNIIEKYSFLLSAVFDFMIPFTIEYKFLITKLVVFQPIK